MNKKESFFQFTNPKISEILFAPTGESVSSKLKDVLDTIQVKSDVSRDSEKNIATVTLTVSNFDKDDLDNDNAISLPYLIRIGYTAEFHWDNSDVHNIDMFLNINAPALLLGYIRPQISEITSRAGFEPLYLPFLDFTDEQNSDKK
ncbi:protein-export chaperone SecB [Leuconostoc citreum]|uniref:protein-export chaperone SecB n=1 Tax=Leuconostoc citreum TaxID=33964 RepID=UPI00186BA41D|nr:protein-export chaperone SecB [Leuconostoc citreum]MBE4726279.1 protein-export chaperone SecB [Leuconostoc citreum]